MQLELKETLSLQREAKQEGVVAHDYGVSKGPELRVSHPDSVDPHSPLTGRCGWAPSAESFI